MEAVAAADGATLIGRVRLDDAAHGVTSTEAISTPTVVFHGVLHNVDRLRRILRVPATTPTEKVVAGLYAEEGREFVNRLEGEFCLALVDPVRAEVLLATDPIGSHPVYWRVDAEGLVLASDLSAVLLAAPAAAKLDLRAVADYLTIGAVLGDKTLASGVHALDPGTIVRYDVRRGEASLTPYRTLASLFANKVADRAAYVDALQSTFGQAVQRAASGGAVGLSLSGGLDSRAMLGAMGHEATGLRTYTLGVEGCADQAIAGRMAKIAGTAHTFFRLDQAYLRDFLPNMAQMVSNTDGMYLSHGLTEMLAVRFLDQTGIRILLRGHGGELAKAHLAWPLHTDARVYEMTTLDELVPYLSARANYITPNLSLAQLLTPDAYTAAGNGAAVSFAEALKDTHLSAADACSYLYLREFSRRFTVPSLELFRTRVDVRLPYLDMAFLQVLLAAPSRWRDTTEIHQRLTASGNPALLRVRNSNTGARADAGRLEEFVLDKCNTALKRLNVRGYRHYHNFDGWMRSTLLDSVEAELLQPTARVQGFVSRQILTDLIRDTRDGKADRSYLLQVLLILELWLRENRVEAA